MEVLHRSGPPVAPAAQQQPRCTLVARRVLPTSPVLARGLLLQERGAAGPAHQQQQQQQQQQQSAAAAAVTGSRAEAEPEAEAGTGTPEEYRSTAEHRFWVYSTALLSLAATAKGLSATESPLEGAAALLGAYLLADFLSGVYHWGVDNYGDGSTPVFGSQIAAFQGHHQWPWTITKREFCNNVHKVFRPALPVAGAALAASPWLPGPATAFFASATLLTALSQQCHAWAHSRKSALPPPVVWLQDRGVLVSRKAHGAHHRAPFEGYYCIVSGLWNPILDAGGSDQGFFRRLERFIAARTGVEPRCWHPPVYDWQEAEGAPVHAGTAAAPQQQP